MCMIMMTKELEEKVPLRMHSDEIAHAMPWVYW